MSSRGHADPLSLSFSLSSLRLRLQLPTNAEVGIRTVADCFRRFSR